MSNNYIMVGYVFVFSMLGGWTRFYFNSNQIPIPLQFQKYEPGYRQWLLNFILGRSIVAVFTGSITFLFLYEQQFGPSYLLGCVGVSAYLANEILPILKAISTKILPFWVEKSITTRIPTKIPNADPEESNNDTSNK